MACSTFWEHDVLQAVNACADMVLRVAERRNGSENRVAMSIFW